MRKSVRGSVALVVGLFFFYGLSSRANSSDTSFSIYYGAYAPLPSCEAPVSEALPEKNEKNEMEVRYLYGRNVLGYTYDGDISEDDQNLDYGWSLKGYSVSQTNPSGQNP